MGFLETPEGPYQHLSVGAESVFLAALPLASCGFLCCGILMAFSQIHVCAWLRVHVCSVYVQVCDLHVHVCMYTCVCGTRSQTEA